jgi:hypothetical protein
MMLSLDVCVKERHAVRWWTMVCPYSGSSDQRVGHESPAMPRLPVLRHVDCRACSRWWTQARRQVDTAPLLDFV